VHNLRQINWRLKEQGFDWANDFDANVKKQMVENPENLMDIMRHPKYSSAVPTPEHFLPLVYLAGLCAAEGSPAEVLVEGGTMGSLTMTSFVLGCGAIAESAIHGAAASLPNPAEVPPQHTNT
jgi:4,5-DOPA dioxygenase extradiol